MLVMCVRVLTMRMKVLVRVTMRRRRSILRCSLDVQKGSNS
jgi:hypothetical protein